VKIDPKEAAKFYRADDLKIFAIEDDLLGISFNGKLEVSVSSEGPWVLME